MADFSDDLILPEGSVEREDYFAMTLWPIVDQIYKMQKKQLNLDDYMLVVPTKGEIGKFYIVHKKSIENQRPR